MANNEYVNRVDYGDDTLIDISDTTAEAGDVLQGETFYLRSGAPATGTLGDATQSTHGLMSANDKIKLDNIEEINPYNTITTSTPMIHLTDAAEAPIKEMEIEINPIQGYNGYDHLWVGGTQKNLLDPNNIEIGSFNQETGEPSNNAKRLRFKNFVTLSAGTYTVSDKNNLLVVLYVYDTNNDFILNESRVDWQNSPYTFTLTETRNIKLAFRKFNSAAIVVPEFIEGQCELGPTATVYEPYENLYPINEYNNINISSNKFNCYPEEWIYDGHSIRDDGDISAGTTNSCLRTDFFPILPNTTYYYNFPSLDPPKQHNIFWYNAQQQFIRVDKDVASFQITSPENAMYAKISTSSAYNSGSGIYNNDICLNISDETRNGEYEAYQGNIYNISLPETIYNGKLIIYNNGTGILQSTRKKITISEGSWSLDTNNNENNQIWILSASDMKTSTSLSIKFPQNTYASESELKADLGDTPIVYELKTPVTYQLTVPQIRTLLSDNNIYTNAGNILSCTYVNQTIGLINSTDKVELNFISNLISTPVTNKFLKGDGTWDNEVVMLTYDVNTWDDFIEAYQQNKSIYCKVFMNSNQIRMAALTFCELKASNTRHADFVYYRVVSDGLDEIHTYKLFSDNTWSSTTHTQPLATTTTDGLMSSADKVAINTISDKVSGPNSSVNNQVAIFDGTTGKVIKDSGFTIAKSVPADAKFTDTTYPQASTTLAGLMSTADKIKLNALNETKLTTITDTIFGSKVRSIDDTILYNSALRLDGLAFLPASQVIILQTTDGGETWTDAGVSDETKYKLFSSHDDPIFLPQIDGNSNSNCGLKIIFTNAKYDVPANTSEINKHNYWNSTYYQSLERKMYLKKLHLMCRGKDGIADYSVNNMTIQVDRENSAGGISNVNSSSNVAGTDIYINLSGDIFNTTHNIILTIFSTNNYTQRNRCIIGICGQNIYNEVNNNNLSTTGHLYAYDYLQNAIFPRDITASTYYGDVQATNLRAVNSAYFRGDLYVQCDSSFENGGKVATESYVNTALANASISGGGGVSTPMGGATASTDGTTGLVPAPLSSDLGNFLSADGTWKPGGKPMVVLSYGTSTWAEFEQAFNDHVIVYCRASSNSNPASGAQTRQAFMAYVNADPPTEVEFQYYRSVSSHGSSQMGDQVFIYKLNKTSGWSVTTREASLKQILIGSGDAASVSYSSNKITLKSGLPAVTAADNGKILQVVNGVWTAVTPS